MHTLLYMYICYTLYHAYLSCYIIYLYTPYIVLFCSYYIYAMLYIYRYERGAVARESQSYPVNYTRN